MLFALIGSSGSGKSVLANHLKETYGFHIIDIREAFYNSLPKTIKDVSKKSDLLAMFYSKEHTKTIYSIFEKAFLDSIEHWNENAVIYPITTHYEIELLRSRKFVYLLGISGPIKLRYANFQKKYDAMSLESFVAFDDSINYSLSGYSSEISDGITYADNQLSNSGSLEDLKTMLKAITFTNDELLRPQWDTYFLQVAELVSKRSNCIRRAVGAVMVKDYRIVATGYNGAPFGIINCNKGGCPRCSSAKEVGKDLDKCICIHAEENAVIEAGRAKAEGATIYTTLFPCLICTKAMIQSGVKRVVYFREYDMGYPLELFKKAGVEVKQHSPFVGAHYLKL